jgi:YidC/Oxa1 family membrane protein insertase
MFDLIASLLNFCYRLIPDYGAAIALLTLAVMILLTPLTLKGTRSMMMMQNLQPEMKKLQAQYKDDRQKLNEEVLKLYRENNVNPLSGCLPLLVQLPVFWVLFRVLEGMTHLSNGVFAPKYLDKSSELYHALVGKTEMRSWGMNLADSSIKAMQHSFTTAIPYLLLIVGVFVSSVIQQRQISGRNPAARDNPQTQLMMKLGPAMITFFSIVAPGGLIIYFFVSNLFRVGQQALISHTIYKTPEAKAMLERQAKEAEERRAKAATEPKKGFFERMLGDAAPQVREQRQNAQNARNRARGAAGNGKGSSTGSNGSGDKQPVKPPLAKSGGGRATPPGSRSSASRKKRKRK